MSTTAQSPAPSPPLYSPHPPSIKDLILYFDRLSKLLGRESTADQARTSLLATNCSWEVLAQRGLALNGLGVSGISIGLGGKSLIALHRPSAFHTDPALPSHTFRPGDPASVIPHEAVRKSAAKGSSKKGAVMDAEGANGPVEGVVYKVTETTITLAVSPRDGEDLELPERCRLIKMANSGTFDRMEKAVERVRRLLGVPPTVVAAAVVPPASEKGPVVAETKEAQESSSEKQASLEPAKEEEEEEEVVVATAALDLNSSTIVSPTPLNPPTLPSSLKTTSNHPSFPLLRTLFGLDPPTSTPLDAPIVWYDETLNESQKVAVRFSLESDKVACIHGPPGTGKTFTLVEIIRQLVQTQKKKVLVCGASNLSVDNLLLRLSPLFPATSITRIGHPARILPSLLTQTLDYQTAHSSAAEIVKDVKTELEGHLSALAKGRKEKGSVNGKMRGEVYGEVRELRKEFRVRESKVVRNVLSTTEIVLATCHTAGARQLMNMDFDVVIIDEATQALEAVCLIPVLKAKKLVLAGDPHQLPPTIISDTGKRRKEASKKAVRKPTQPESKPSSFKVTEEPPSTKEDESPASTPSDLDGEEEKEDASSETEEAPPTSESATSTQVRRTRLRPSNSLEVTLFDRLERLFGPGIKRMLQVQYRMNSQIASFPSSALYSSLLVSADSVASRTLLTLPTVEDPSEEAIEFLEPPVVFMDTAGCEFYERGDGGEGGGSGVGEGSKLNENEAEVVRQYVEKLISFGVPPADIGVLAAYQAQVSHLSGLLKPLYPELLIGTVDSLQGQEREAIVLSLVRSNAKREVGFLAEERRLNVGMTRAKRQLCVVGDSATVANGSEYLKSWMSWLEANADVRFAGDVV